MAPVNCFSVFCEGRVHVETLDKENATGHDLLTRYGVTRRFEDQEFAKGRVDDFYILCNGRKFDEDNKLENGKTYHIVPRLLGGKGGFGSMLRAIGAQIEKTTSREACRDLSGRRMRDINNEKKLKEWMSKEADREKEKEERRKARLERKLYKGQHKFEDKEYHDQKAKVQEDLEDALQTGLKRALKNGEQSSSNGGAVKKMKPSNNTEWLGGVDLDSDDLDSDSDAEASPGSPTLGVDASTSVSPRDESSSSASTHETDTVDTDSGVGEDHLDSKQGGQQHSLLSKLPPPSSDSGQTNPGRDGEKLDDDNVCSTEVEIDPNTPVDLDVYSSCEELSALGLDRLKYALMTRGMKCGGTLEERAARLFSVKGLQPNEIDPSLLAKSKGKGKKSK